MPAGPGAPSRSATGGPPRDFAQCMRDLVDLHYPEARLISVVLDNMSTHSLRSAEWLHAYSGGRANPMVAPCEAVVASRVRSGVSLSGFSCLDAPT
jgi:hypothetical protein